MSRHRWSKFWWQDWQREPSLRMCSLAARGFWMELLCVAHEGDPYGHITVNGRAPTNRQLSGVAGVSEAEATKLLRELEDAGVFSRDDGGVIFCRRMVRDKATSEVAREFGKTGGNPSLNGSKPHKVNGGGNPGGLTPPVNRGPNLQEAEAEFKKKEAEVPPLPPLGGLRARACREDPLFARFYAAYPRHDAPDDALKAWRQVTKAGAEPEEIMAGLARYEFRDDPRFVRLPASWLRGGCWRAELDTFDPVLRAAGLAPEDFEAPEPFGLLQ